MGSLERVNSLFNRVGILHELAVTLFHTGKLLLTVCSKTAAEFPYVFMSEYNIGTFFF